MWETKIYKTQNRENSENDIIMGVFWFRLQATGQHYEPVGWNRL
jgi:hypothetical protein